MSIQDLGAIGEIVGAIAVILTLIYLATQIRQNNALLRSGSRQSLVANDVSSLTANIEISEVFAKFVSNQKLTSEDQLRLSFIFSIDLRNREFEYFQFKNGLLDEETWLSYRNVILINHSSKLGRKWWDQIGREFVDPEFADQVDDLLASATVDNTYEKMSTWAEGD